MPQSTRIYLSLGSNLGDRAANLQRGIDALAGSGVAVLRRSSLYLTEPVGLAAQPWFLNCAVEADTALMPLQLLHALRRIERELGSRKLTPQGPRVLDLDILLYGSSVIRSRELAVPHPRMAERRFVLAPLAELAPELHHPGLGATIGQLLAATRDTASVRPWPGHNPDNDW